MEKYLFFFVTSIFYTQEDKKLKYSSFFQRKMEKKIEVHIIKYGSYLAGLEKVVNKKKKQNFIFW